MLEVLGVGAVVVPTPPVALVYHLSPDPVATSGLAVPPRHSVTRKPTVGAEGVAYTITLISFLGLSQPDAEVCVTQKELAPVLLVLGVGAVVLKMVPVSELYHFKEVPLAVNGLAVAFEQYSTGELTVGAAGVGLTVTVMAVRGPSQPKVFVWLT